MLFIFWEGILEIFLSLHFVEMQQVKSKLCLSISLCKNLQKADMYVSAAKVEISGLEQEKKKHIEEKSPLNICILIKSTDK